MSSFKLSCAIVFALGALGTTGCSAARVCRGITARGDEIKFLYYEGGDTGVIKCKVGADGGLSDCRPMTVKLED